MVIGIISDTHRKKNSIKKVINKLNNIDVNVLIHLGDNVEDIEQLKYGVDIPIINVRGNCDFSLSVPLERLEILGGKKIFITHGHKYSVKYDLMKLRYRALELEADIVLYGHTHIPNIEFNDGIWFVNPGSAAISRGRYNSFGLIDISDEKIIPSIIEI